MKIQYQIFLHFMSLVQSPLNYESMKRAYIKRLRETS